MNNKRGNVAPGQIAAIATGAVGGAALVAVILAWAWHGRAIRGLKTFDLGTSEQMREQLDKSLAALRTLLHNTTDPVVAAVSAYLLGKFSDLRNRLQPRLDRLREQADQEDAAADASAEQ